MQNKMKKIIGSIRLFITDLIASYIATWTFILSYTGIMILWICLHKFGILHVDSNDFIKYNLFLSWAAGIQASVVLMAANRQTERDRVSILTGIELDKKTFDLTSKQGIKISSKLNELYLKIDKLEEIITLMEIEEGDIQNEKKGS